MAMKLGHGITVSPSGRLDVVNQKFVTDTIATPLAGGLEFLDKITVAGAAVQTVTFSATGDGVNKYDVNGNTDEIYYIVGKIKIASASSQTYSFQPNNLATNQTSEGHTVNAGTVAGFSTSTLHIYGVGTGANAQEEITFEATFDARTGFFRPYKNRLTGYDSTGTDGTVLSNLHGTWADSSTNVTSLRFTSTVAATYGIGTTFELYRLRATPAVQITHALGGLEFLDRIAVSANTTSVTFGAAGNGIFARALDGDVDEEYICRYRIVANADTTNYFLRPNGLTTNQYGQAFFGTAAGGTVTDLAKTSFGIGGSNTNVDEYIGEFSLMAKTGRGPRKCSIDFSYVELGGNTTPGRQHALSVWEETVTNITSLEMVASVSNGIVAGSYFELYRRTAKTVRADAASTYERQVTSAVDPNTPVTNEYTTGTIVFGGSLVGFSAKLEEAVTAGTIVVNVKINGVTKLTETLSTTQTTTIRASAGLGTHKLNAGDNLSVEVVPSSYANAGSVVSGITVNCFCVTNALTNPPTGGEWKLVDKVTVTASSGANAVLFSSSGNGSQLYPVNGNVDGGYKITWDLVGNSSTGAAGNLELNGGTTNQTTQRVLGTNTTASAGQTTGVGTFCNSATASSRHTGEWIMERSATGVTRCGRSWRGSHEVGGTNDQSELDTFLYNDSSTNITSIRANITSGDITGTIRLYIRAPEAF